MIFNRLIVLILCFFLASAGIQAQITDPDQARSELAKKNISEDEIEKRLAERGININSIDPTDPGALAEVEAAIQQIIAEIEAERGTNTEEGGLNPQGNAEEKAEGEVIAGTEVDKKVAAIDEQVIEQKEVAELETRKKLGPVTIYGQELFREYEPSQGTDLKPPANYVLGPGDELGIGIFGASVASFSFEINPDGYIQPGSLGRIYLTGLTFEQAKTLLRKRFGQAYSFGPGQFAVTINYSRTITVNIVGNVEKPGSYAISATNTAINALARAGGPSNIGSLRDIKIVGKDGTKTLDIYKFLQNPSSENAFFLQNNDYIHVPDFKKHIIISGAVNRPMKYELIKSENLKELINYASGLKADAYSSNIQVKRFVDEKEKVIDVNYRELLQSSSNFPLLNGDIVTVKSIPTPFKNFVSIDGAVEYSGKYELTSNMKISDLLEKSEIMEEAFLPIAFLKRANFDGTIKYIRLNLNDIITNPNSEKNLALIPKDALSIYAQSSRTIEDESVFNVTGAVQNPNEFRFGTEGSIKIEDALQLAGGIRQDAKKDLGYIIRTNPVTSEPEYIRFNPEKILADPNSTENIVLNPSDRIQILSTRTFLDETFVEVVGAVRSPGEFRWDTSLTLSDILTLSGGVQLSAAKNRVEVFRLEIIDNKPTQVVAATVEVDKDLNVLSGGNADFLLQPYDIIAVRYVPGFDKQEMVSIQGEVNYNGAYPLIADNERLSSLIKRSGGLTNEAFTSGATLFRAEENIGYVVIDLEEIMKNPSSKFNVIMKKGDILSIPKAKDLVTIQGATQARELYNNELVAGNKVTVPYLKTSNARHYVNEYAAGFSENARRGKVTVKHPNGELKRTVDFGVFKIYPKVQEGSVINIPYKSLDERKDKKKADKEPVDWGKVLADSIVQATAVLSLILLLQSVNN